MRRFLASAAISCALLVSAHAETSAVSKSADTHQSSAADFQVATFAGGCFWSMESAFDHLPGVKKAVSGFMGGRTDKPTYAQVSAGTTGHAESVQVTYDPNAVSYEKLVDYYWHHIDLLDSGGQFCDRGNQYRPVIFAHTPEQKRIAEQSRSALDASHRFSSPVAVEIAAAGPFTAAEEYHQNFQKKNPDYYNRYRIGCRRDARLKEIWGAEADTAAH
jgi:peptide-methionine (S)-S-oxide reductase